MSGLGSIVFGMEDGTASIFGLVFGVAASATNSQTVLLSFRTSALNDVECGAVGRRARQDEFPL